MINNCNFPWIKYKVIYKKNSAKEKLKEVSTS